MNSAPASLALMLIVACNADPLPADAANELDQSVALDSRSALDPSSRVDFEKACAVVGVQCRSNSGATLTCGGTTPVCCGFDDDGSVACVGSLADCPRDGHHLTIGCDGDEDCAAPQHCCLVAPEVLACSTSCGGGYLCCDPSPECCGCSFGICFFNSGGCA